jgi:hypothetical protein
MMLYSAIAVNVDGQALVVVMGNPCIIGNENRPPLRVEILFYN